jgi:predicted naringenin-chalcone synthase
LQVKVIGASQPAAPGVATAPREREPLPASASQSAVARLASPCPAGPRIVGLELADADTSFSQDQVLTMLDMKGDEFAERIFSRCGVERRHLSLSGASLATTLQGRTEQIEEELFGFAVEAVDRLQIDPLEIGTVVTATLYSLGGPTLAHRLVDHYDMDPATDKYHVLGVGCASAVPLMRLTAQLMRDHPGKKGLIVAAESMAGILMRASDDDAKAKVVGSSLFGDGCAAALLDGDPVAGLDNGAGVGSGADGPTIVASKVHQIGRTLGAVKLTLDAEDSYLHLDRDLPDKAGAGLRVLVEDFLDTNGLARADIDHWIVHPGGRRIIESVQETLELSREQVGISYDVLANHGNVGTPSIFYVLKKTVEQRSPQAGELGLMVTIGPGITVGLLLLQW